MVNPVPAKRYNITMFLNAWGKCPVDEPNHYPWFFKAGAYLPFLLFKYVIMPEIARAWKRQIQEEAKEVENHKETHRLIKEQPK